MSENSNEANASTEIKDYEQLSETEDFKKFISMKIMSDELKADSPEELSQTEKRELVNQYNSWVKANRPSAKMPDTQELKTHIVNKVYRIKKIGEQFLVYVDGEGKHIGRDEKLKYALIDEVDEDGNKTGKKVQDKGQVVSRDWVFNIPYDKDKAKELVQQCLETSMNPSFYFGRVVGNKFVEKYYIENVDNFTGNFDTLTKKAREHQVI